MLGDETAFECKRHAIYHQTAASFILSVPPGSFAFADSLCDSDI